MTNAKVKRITKQKYFFFADGRPNNIYNKLLLNRANEKRIATMGHLTGRAKHEKKKRSF